MPRKPRGWQAWPTKLLACSNELGALPCTPTLSNCSPSTESFTSNINLRLVPIFLQERQHLKHCLVHSLNGLLQRNAVSHDHLNRLADALTPPVLGIWSPHRQARSVVAPSCKGSIHTNVQHKMKIYPLDVWNLYAVCCRCVCMHAYVCSHVAHFSTSCACRTPVLGNYDANVLEAALQEHGLVSAPSLIMLHAPCMRLA